MCERIYSNKLPEIVTPHRARGFVTMSRLFSKLKNGLRQQNEMNWSERKLAHCREKRIACVAGRIRVLLLERPPPFLSRLILLGPIVRKAVSANLGLKFQLGFDFSCTKAYIRANFLCAFILVSEAKLKEKNIDNKTLWKAIKLH